MITVASALLLLSLSANPQKVYIDPRIREAAEEEKAQEKKYINKKTGRRDEKGMCKAGCQQVTSLCLSNCRGQQACKDNCANTIEKSCLKGCVNKRDK